MKDKLHSSIRGASKGEGIPHDILNYTSSVIDPETSEALSEKISSMLPNIGTIRATGIIKNTDSFQESKDLLTNFKTSLHKLNKDVMKEPDYSYEKSDGRSALEHATDAIERVVVFMTRANIEVPSIYHEFLSQVRPKKIESPDVCIEKKEPLYKITGLNENGEVKIETDTPLILKKGKTEIALTNEKLKETLFNSQKVDSKMIQDLHTWVKNNLHRAGTLEKIDDVEWKNLRQSIIDNYNQRKRSETTVCEKDYPMSAKIDEILSESLDEEIVLPTVKEKEQKVKIEVPKSVNLNAYEIRLQVLQDALEWVKHNKNTNKSDDVIETAVKFYKFVEQKNRNECYGRI